MVNLVTLAHPIKSPSTAANGLGRDAKEIRGLTHSDDTTRRARAIQTAYKGYRFRSRLEARYAVFFDALGVRWEYEKEGYELEGAGRYLPDFWLPELECFVEVKGAPPSPDEIHLADLLRQHTGSPVVLVHGEVSAGPWPCFAHDIGHSSGGSSYWDVYWFVCECGRPKVSWGDGCHLPVNGETWASLARWCGWTDAIYQTDTCGPAFPVYMAISSTSRAVNAARSARFEFGAHG